MLSRRMGRAKKSRRPEKRKNDAAHRPHLLSLDDEAVSDNIAARAGSHGKPFAGGSQRRAALDRNQDRTRPRTRKIFRKTEHLMKFLAANLRCTVYSFFRNLKPPEESASELPVATH